MQKYAVYDKEEIKKSIVSKLQRHNGCSLAEATEKQIYNAVADTVRDQIMNKLVATRQAVKQQKGKQLYYLSVEFLMGRSLHSNILNLCETAE